MFGQVQGHKPTHYLKVLDEARCNGQYENSHEIIRKNEKHNRTRECLVVAYKIEKEINAQTLNLLKPHQQKGYATLKGGIEELKNALSSTREDELHVQVTIAWTEYWLTRYDVVLTSLPADFGQRVAWVKNANNVYQRYTYIVIIKAAYVRGAALRKLNKLKEAGKWFLDMFELIKELSRSAPATTESQRSYLLWYERYVYQFCLSSRFLNEAVFKRARVANSSEDVIRKEMEMDAFHEWKRFASMPQQPEMLDQAFAVHEQPFIRVKSWGSYYDTLSRILALDFLPEPLMRPQELYEDLKFVEDHFAAAMNTVSRFPAADQATVNLNNWICQMAGNWKILMSASWSQEYLGHDGSLVLSNRLLEYLYQAAALTYQSTRIYRLLFLVHLALADFKHARLSLATYVAFLEKSRLRIQKSGQPDDSVDHHGMALMTLSAGLEVFSRYGGSKREVKLANRIRTLLDPMLYEAEHAPASRKAFHIVEPNVIGRVYRAIGLSSFHFMSHDVSTQQRMSLERTAIKSLTKANHDDYRDPDNIFTLFWFALLLAEGNDDSRAIAILKEILKPPRIKRVEIVDAFLNNKDMELPPLNFDVETRTCLLRSWHLLALLLSRKEARYETAYSCIHSAFEPYGGITTLRGSAEGVPSDYTLAMEEGQCLVDLKMTEIALIKSQSGAEKPSVLDKCEELIKLYTNFFGRPMRSTTPERVMGIPPPSKVFRHSLRVFARNPESYSEPRSLAAPAIAITSDDTTTLPQDTNHHRRFLGRHTSNKLQKRASRKSLTSANRSRTTSGQQSRAASPSAASSTKKESGSRGPGYTKSKPPDLKLSPQQYVDGNTPVDSSSSLSQSPDQSIGIAMTHDMPQTPPTSAGQSSRPNALRTIPSAAKNMNQKNPNSSPVSPKMRADTPDVQRYTEELASFYVPMPIWPRYLQDRRNRAFLISLWLFIAAQYRSEDMFSDSARATDEAQHLAEHLQEYLAARDGISVSNLTKLGHGGLKSYSEISADILCERGQLVKAHGDRKTARSLYQSALSKCSKHVAAAVCLAELDLDAYQPLYEARQRVADKEGDLERGKYPQDQLLALLSRNCEVKLTKDGVKEMISGRDRAMESLELVSQSGQGYRDLGLWSAHNRATRYQMEPKRHRDVAGDELELSVRAPVRAYSILRSMNN